MGKATRAAYGETLIELAREGLDVVAIDADLSGSTTTAKFGAEYPDRFFNAGIAEANMTGVAAGLAKEGKIAFTGSFAVFGTGRAWEQIRNTVCANNLDVKIAPTHAGVTVGPDGGSHQALEDITIMRVLPNMRVIVPADHASAKAAIRLAAQTSGPFYIRLGRMDAVDVYEEGFELELGRAYVLREGSDVTIAACGIEVDQALKAAELLETEGVQAEVIDVVSVKPLDVETILASVRKTGRIVTCEEHSVLGGMGSAISEVLSEIYPVPTRRIGIVDTFGQSGDPHDLIEHYRLDSASIAAAARELLT
ncbi:MAG: transketolase family protein [Coriobacteriia bacterium]|nr:transketolase family protein [Coriobacteriia bacterium]